MNITVAHTKYNVPWGMLDLMEQYLEHKCIKCCRYKGTPFEEYPVDIPPDNTADSTLEIYGVNDEMWKRVVRVELNRIACDKKYTLYENPQGNKATRIAYFRPNPPCGPIPLEFVSYDGEFPNLCKGVLVLKFQGVKFSFSGVLKSGGTVSLGEPCDAIVSYGDWGIHLDTLHSMYPTFPPDMYPALILLANKHIPAGCCGGCS